MYEVTSDEVKTWGDFKKAVEACGIKDSDKVLYINWDAPFVRIVKSASGFFKIWGRWDKNTVEGE